MNSTVIQSIGWLALLPKNVTKPSFESERMQEAERSQLPRLLSSDDFNRRRGVAMSITVSISAVQSHTPDVGADEMSNSRRSPSFMSISVGVDHPCCAVESPTDLFEASHWLARSCRFPAVTLLVFSRADHNTSQVLTTSYVVFISTFSSKSLQANQTSADWFHGRDVTRRG